MRLVDADKQLEWVDCMTPIHGIGLEPVVAVETVRDLIQGAPTVEAIPVEWMKHRLTMALKNGSDAPEQAIRYVLWLWEQQKDGEQEAHDT